METSQTGSMPRPIIGPPLYHADCDEPSHTERKLIMDAHSIFLELQRLEGELRVIGLMAGTTEYEEQRQARILGCSQQYRSAIFKCYTELNAEAAPDAMGSESAEDMDESTLAMLQYADMIREAASLLHLCEIFFINSIAADDTPVYPRLVEWVARRSEEADTIIAQILAKQEDLGNDPQFWSYLCRCVALGRLEEARMLLERCMQTPSADDDPLQLLDLLHGMIVRMPSPDKYSQQDYFLAWVDWQDQCKGVLQELRGASDRGSIEQGSQDVLLVMCGEKEALVKYSRHWYELLLAKLLYLYPAVTATTLRTRVLRESVEETLKKIEEGGEGEPLSGIDEVFVDVMSYESTELLLMKVCKYFPPKWISATLSDLLYHYRIKGESSDLIGEVREFIVLDYVEWLMGKRAMWQVALNYLMVCPHAGSHVAEIIIERQPVDSDVAAHKLLAACERIGLQELSGCVCRVLGVRRLKQGRYAAAAYWLNRAGDTRRLGLLSERLLSKAVREEKNWGDVCSVAALGLESLRFVNMYVEARGHLSAKRYVDAARVFGELLEGSMAFAGKTVPREFVTHVLHIALPLLQDPKQVWFNMTDTYRLMHYLQTLSLSHRSAENFAAVPDEVLTGLRVALVRNLARATCRTTPAAR
mmetsp:Transcript_43435/g.70468  ORF Transcript_43435/g.70468 Transcript_43435/m.70468 type:complete len:645 (-) Transcript_43435:153-2087(-)